MKSSSTFVHFQFEMPTAAHIILFQTATRILIIFILYSVCLRLCDYHVHYKYLYLIVCFQVGNETPTLRMGRALKCNYNFIILWTYAIKMCCFFSLFHKIAVLSFRFFRYKCTVWHTICSTSSFNYFTVAFFRFTFIVWWFFSFSHPMIYIVCIHSSANIHILCTANKLYWINCCRCHIRQQPQLGFVDRIAKNF